MPRKVRELLAEARKTGFVLLPGKGSHRKVIHPLLPGSFSISGQEGADVKPYQEKALLEAIEALKKARKNP